MASGSRTGRAASGRERRGLRQTGAIEATEDRQARAGGYLPAVRRALPFGLASAAFGVSFGVLALAAGMGKLAPVVMSATTFGGSAQFAVASILGAGGGALAATLAAVMLNSRYAPMALAAAPALEGGRLRRGLEAQLVVDESWALSNRGGRFHRPTLIGSALVMYVGWVGGTAAGVLAGASLGDPEDLGLDAAFPALFLALLAGQIASRRALAAALLGAAIALALVPLTPAGVPVIAATLACLVGLGRSSAEASG